MQKTEEVHRHRREEKPQQEDQPEVGLKKELATSDIPIKVTLCAVDDHAQKMKQRSAPWKQQDVPFIKKFKN